MPTLTPMKAIRARCLECAGRSMKAVRECARGSEATEPCPLHPYRMGRNPARAGIGRCEPNRNAHSGKFRPS
jgi:hypothetical protein